VASEFRLTRDRPVIVKLHGDYLYDNLQNTYNETSQLDPGFQEVLDQTVSEYGLVVIGYGGKDESIMEPLLEADLSEYGIYWCVQDRNSLSLKAKEILTHTNTFFVEIKSFENLMLQFAKEIKEIEPPHRDELVERAENRAEKLEKAFSSVRDDATDETEAKVAEKLNLEFELSNASINGNYGRAVEVADHILNIDPTDATVLFRRGNAKIELNEAKAAKDDYERGLELKPDDAIAHVNYAGLLKNEFEEYEEAREHYERGLKLEPNDANAHNNYAGLLKDAYEEYEEAREHYERGLELDPNNATVHNNYALLLKVEYEEYEEARKHYERALELNPGYAEAHDNYANLLADGFEEYEEARKHHKRSIEIDPKNAITHTNFAGLLKDPLEEYEKAREHYERAINENPDYGRAHTNYGLLLADVFANYERAIEQHNRAIKLNPNKPRPRLERALLKIQTGDLEGAKKDAEEIRSLNTSREDLARGLLLSLISSLLLGGDVARDEDEYRDLCSTDFTTAVDSEKLDSWLQDADVDSAERERIREWIDLLKEHKE